MDSLDVIAVLLAYISIHNYGANQESNNKLDVIIYDFEQKLNNLENKINLLLERSNQWK